MPETQRGRERECPPAGCANYFCEGRNKLHDAGFLLRYGVVVKLLALDPRNFASRFAE